MLALLVALLEFRNILAEPYIVLGKCMLVQVPVLGG